MLAGGSHAHESHLAVHSFEQPRAKGYTARNEFNVADRWWDKGIRSVTPDIRPIFHLPSCDGKRHYFRQTSGRTRGGKTSRHSEIFMAQVFYVERIKEPRYKNYSRQCCLPLRLLLPSLSCSDWFLGPSRAWNMFQYHNYLDWLWINGASSVA